MKITVTSSTGSRNRRRRIEEAKRLACGSVNLGDLAKCLASDEFSTIFGQYAEVETSGVEDGIEDEVESSLISDLIIFINSYCNGEIL